VWCGVGDASQNFMVFLLEVSVSSIAERESKCSEVGDEQRSDEDSLSQSARLSETDRGFSTASFLLMVGGFTRACPGQPTQSHGCATGQAQE